MMKMNWNFLAGGVAGIAMMFLASNITIPSHTKSTKALLLVKNSSISSDICTVLPQVTNLGTIIKDKSGEFACVINTRIDWNTKDSAVLRINTYPIFTNIESFKKNKSLGINYSLIEELCDLDQYEKNKSECPKITKILESSK